MNKKPYDMFDVIVNGICPLCGKNLEKGRLFLCQDCQKKEDELCENRRYAIPKKH